MLLTLNKSKLRRNMIQTADTRLIVIQHLGLSDPDFIFPWPTLIIRSPLFVNHFHILVHVYNEIKPMALHVLLQLLSDILF